MKNKTWSILILFLIIVKGLNAQNNPTIDKYNVIWNTPSKDVSGVMPIGNGDLGAGVYAIEGGDLYLLLSKSDAYNYMGDLFKTGRVRISLTPNPFIKGCKFKQTLDLLHGCISIQSNGVKIRIWTDVNYPVYNIDITTKKSIGVTVSSDLWERFDHCAYNLIDNYSERVLRKNSYPTQDIFETKKNEMIWYYAVGNRSIYKEDLKYYGIDNEKFEMEDPFQYNTFGNLVRSSQLKLKNKKLIGKGNDFKIKIYSLTEKTKYSETWKKNIRKLAQRYKNDKKNWNNHCKWWGNFWNKSWIIASNKNSSQDKVSTVAQSYNIFRFLMGCQSRGNVPTKFNGGLFTQQLKIDANEKAKRSGKKKKIAKDYFSHEDARLWGRRFTFQNQRLLYWPLLASGDYKLLKPFFNYYLNLLPIRKAITKAWYGHKGVYFRENIEPTGAERDCGKNGKPSKLKIGESSDYYHQLYFTSGLELVTMMIEYVNYTNDILFMQEKLAPFAKEIMLFYAYHYPRDKKGKLYLAPSQVLETYWFAENPSCDIAGLKHGLKGLLKLKCGTKKDLIFWKNLLNELPQIPTNVVNGVKYILPAKKYSHKRNYENGELYPVFPFTEYGVAYGNENIVSNTLKRRTEKNMFGYSCWSQDQIDYAYAGNAKEAANGLIHRFSVNSSKCRFPFFGKENPDSCPDLDHFGSGSIALQKMLVQEGEEKIVLFPAWPKTWDVNFKIHIRNGAYVHGKVSNGHIIEWGIFPKNMRKKVIVMPLQRFL